MTNCTFGLKYFKNRMSIQVFCRQNIQIVNVLHSILINYIKMCYFLRNSFLYLLLQQMTGTAFRNYFAYTFIKVYPVIFTLHFKLDWVFFDMYIGTHPVMTNLYRKYIKYYYISYILTSHILRFYGNMFHSVKL